MTKVIQRPRMGGKTTELAEWMLTEGGTWAVIAPTFRQACTTVDVVNRILQETGRIPTRGTSDEVVHDTGSIYAVVAGPVGLQNVQYSSQVAIDNADQIAPIQLLTIGHMLNRMPDVITQTGVEL